MRLASRFVAPPTLRPFSRRATRPGMGFRVVIAGPRRFTDYPALRAALDALLVNHLPDVELLTCGGPGVPILAASYTAAHNLLVTVRVADFARFPVDAVERRDAFSRREADTVVV